jgi:hypothetical protein
MSKLFSISSEIVCSPVIFVFSKKKKVSMSFKNNKKRKGDRFSSCLTPWKLKVNADKTKVMVFGNGRLPQNLSFSYDNLNLEIVKKIQLSWDYFY